MSARPPLLLAAALLAGCGGAPALWPDGAEPLTAPLVEAWRPSRFLVEVEIDGRGPYLFALEPALPESAISERLAQARRLPLLGRPARGPGPVHARVGRLTVGDTALEDVRMRLLAPHAFGTLHDRLIVGVLGRPFFAGRVTTVDPARGILRNAAAAGTPPSPDAVVVEARADPGVGWRIPVRIDGVRARAAVGWSGASAAIRRSFADASALTPALVGTGWRADIDVGGLATERVPLRPYEGPAGVDAELGWPVFAGRGARLDAVAEQLTLWPVTWDGAHLRRFGFEPPAFRLEIVELMPGEAVLAVRGTPSQPPEPFWMVFDLGLADGTAPYPVRVRFGLGARPSEVRVRRDDLEPALLRAIGDTAPLVDIVPLGHPCPGEVCVRQG